MLLGSKETIGLEFSLEKTNIPNRNYGYINLYLNNMALGYYSDLINLDAFNYQLSRIIETQDVFFEEFDNMSFESIFQKIIGSDDEKFDKSLLSFGESFDDFDIMYFKIKEDVRFGG